VLLPETGARLRSADDEGVPDTALIAFVMAMVWALSGWLCPATSAGGCWLACSGPGLLSEKSLSCCCFLRSLPMPWVHHGRKKLSSPHPWLAAPDRARRFLAVLYGMPFTMGGRSDSSFNRPAQMQDGR